MRDTSFRGVVPARLPIRPLTLQQREILRKKMIETTVIDDARMAAK